jgi:hypothetical protein
MLKYEEDGKLFRKQIPQSKPLKEVKSMARVKMPYPLAHRHLCFLEDAGFMRPFFEEYKGLVKNSKFVCTKCGRTAAKGENLCTPEEL